VVCGQSGVGRITTSGTVSGFATSTGVGVRGIATGSDGALWFGEGNKIARITTSGALTEFALPTTSTGNLCGVAAGPDGAVWFAEQIGKIGRITTSETITEYPLPADAGYPFAITAGPDGAMWFTRMGAGNVSNGVIGRITTPASTASTSPLVAAVLPSSRSVEVGSTATAFATIINSGSSTASGCAVAPVTSVPASFVYQTTNPATNALTGSPNTPASIAAGGSQSFVIAFTPTRRSSRPL
jgi:streptogramin lyase